MIENVQVLADDIEIIAPVAPRQHVRMMGEDMVVTELIFPANHCIRPVNLGAFAGCGLHTVTMRRKPQVVIIPTGSELIPLGQAPEPGQIIEYNSQPGAGTRLLLDYELTKHGIDPASVNGYQHEQPTHLAVAAASGVVDCGLGVRSAVIALGLDFIPIGWERYDLVIPLAYSEHHGIVALLAVLNRDDFKQALGAQPGYLTDKTGIVQYTSE